MVRIAYRSLLLLLLASSLVGAADDTPPSLTVEGYTDRLSYVAGDTVELHVSTTSARYSIEVARLGAESKVVLNQAEIAGGSYPIPENASNQGCGWPVSHRITIPADWKSGYYNVRLKVADGGGKYVGRNRRTAEVDLFFILRSATPGRDSSILLQLATNTYNAYTNWGGSSLYAYHGRAGLQGHRVSFDRPLDSQFRQWELPFVAWAERNGYNIDYAANSDLEFHPELLDHYKLVLSVGHDEYWSTPMRDHLEAFIGRGGNVAFLSGNTCCWQVRSEDKGRALTCWKQGFNQDPVFTSGDHRTLSTLWSHHLVKRPENQLTGVGFLHGGYHLSHGQFMDGKGAYTVHRPEHWIFEGTNVARDGEFGAKHTVVGYECDGCEFEWKDGLPLPTLRDGTPEGFVILATCPTRWHPDDALWYDQFPRDSSGKPALGAAVLGTYTRGGTVVTSGSTDWAHGLRGGDEVVERITRNILDRLSK
ncbi:N,N-dimethylformamidase beta subunit family domain-containing protein [Tundrisphaera lichenicola]|uniref:N,N-dimethylformamidase beta subunit family domain-containing protein n=1 Tax=Tundrisphaera lichenicola TaxID=2029860 RepID=UPI003EBE92D8